MKRFPCERNVKLSDEAEKIIQFLENKGVVLKQFDDGEYDLFIELKKFITSIGGWVLSVNDNHLVCFIVDDSIEMDRVMKYHSEVEDMEDRRKSLTTKLMITLKDKDDARRLNLKDGYWACICGSRKFHLKQTNTNVKAICSKCGDNEIIYWNRPSKDQSIGAMRDLETGQWWRPRAKIVLVE